MSDALIIDACRTPRGIGKQGKGSLSHLHPQHLATTVLEALVERNGFDTADVDDVVWGTSSQVMEQGGDLGRMAALDAGYDITASGATLDRFCGSGITERELRRARGDGRDGGPRRVRRHRDDVAAEEGHAADGCEQRASAGAAPAVPPGRVRRRHRHARGHPPRGARRPRRRVATPRRRGDQEGRFDKSLIPVLNLDGSVALDHEEFPRPETTVESLAELRPSFPEIADYRHTPESKTFRELINQKYPDLDIQHVHHAGNSSGVVDGAAAILFASEDYAKAHGMKARARVVATANMGDDPTLMLNAPVPAARKVLAKAGMTLDDIDIFEINEAFAVVSEKFQRDLDLDRNKVNVNGGAMALGHPIGATGAILIGTVLDELERQDKQVGLITMCAGGGMAPAIIIERV